MSLRMRRRPLHMKTRRPRLGCPAPKGRLVQQSPPPRASEDEPGGVDESFFALGAKNAKKARNTVSWVVPEPEPREPNLIIHATVFALAEKYAVQGLKELAVEKFETEAATHWESSEFLQAAQVAYTSTADSVRGMRDVVLQTYYNKPSLLQKVEAAKLVRDVEDWHTICSSTSGPGVWNGGLKAEEKHRS